MAKRLIFDHMPIGQRFELRNRRDEPFEHMITEHTRLRALAWVKVSATEAKNEKTSVVGRLAGNTRVIPL